ncbi:hypothetical protein E1A91_D02G195400v1 [Gossypium mustelinum]|uniref:Uncharacterized protein n=1 Tax=Gossypium mustelinum TaxID=34275 RepID=A0A5D2VY82_GOSMU|nr:hypothetical protein E1A91_D02G195400v1 [Gossypium mustelinum]
MPADVAKWRSGGGEQNVLQLHRFLNFHTPLTNHRVFFLSFLLAWCQQDSFFLPKLISCHRIGAQEERTTLGLKANLIPHSVLNCIFLAFPFYAMTLSLYIEKIVLSLLMLIFL